jgi:parallel beta-helix repeat protein
MRALPLVLLLLFAALPAEARTWVVKSGESIQAAVDLAASGDTVLVRAGRYSGPGGLALVQVRTSGLSLRATRSAVIDAHGYRYGILVGEDAPIVPEGCPPVTVRGFEISGITIRNAEHTGLRLEGVDGFTLRDGVYLDNDEHGSSPICSSHGLIVGNYAAGHKHAAIYLGESSHVVVERNAVTTSAIGVEIENSSYAIVRKNQLFGNTAGVLVIVLPSLPFPFTDHVRIEGNSIIENNFPNPIAATSGDDVGTIPTGSGILNLGGDHVSIERNVILGNDSFGVATIASPFVALDSRIEPFVDDQRVKRNVILLNGHDPDPLRAAMPGADIVFVPDRIDFATGTVFQTDPDPSDSCYGENRFFTEFPTDVTASLSCP